MIATIAILKKTLAEAKKASEKLFQGEITISKRDCWLIGAILVLTGIAVGLVNAPLTHGVNISLCSNNGNNNGNGSGNGNGADQDASELGNLLPDKKEKDAEKKTAKNDKSKPGRKRKKLIPAG